MSIRPRHVVALTVLATTAAFLPATSASADASTYPPTIAPIVLGDVTGYQWMLDAVNAPAAWTAATGAGVTVADIDTGADATHPDLAGQIVPGAIVQKDSNKKLVLVPATLNQTSDDWYGHGSHVAGIIAANDNGVGMTGIAPGAHVMPIDLLPRRNGPRSDVQFFNMVATSIDYAVANGADVINMSLGGASSGLAPSPRTNKYLAALDAVCSSIAAATTAGTVVVASAGNDGDYGNPENRPAACPGTLTVAALAPSFERTYWSSFDAAVDISAPGLDILSVDSTVSDQSPTPHIQESGTSMASPVVAGVAALVKEQHPAWTVQQIDDQITSTAKDLDVPGRDPNTGFGIVDAAAAVGVSAPAPHRQNFFATWGQDVYGDKGDLVVISWTTPPVASVTGYTVTVHTDTGTTDYDVDGLTVRDQVSLPDGAWWTVTAHTTAGDVTTYPQSGGRSAGDNPQRLTHVKLHRQGDRLTVSWAPPVDPTKIDVIRAWVDFEACRVRSAAGRIKIDQSASFPDHMTVGMPNAARWCDARVHLELLNKDNGNIVGGRFESPPARSPALHGSSVRAVVGAGPKAVEVTGGVSALNALRVCGNHSCAGEPAVLVVDLGHDVVRVAATYTSSGTFHVLVPVDRGTEHVRAKVVGPLRLDSGAFQHFAVTR